MKAILEFDLPEEQESFDYACNATKVQCRLTDFDNWMRSFVKYQDEKDWPNIETVRDKFWEFMKHE